MSFYEANKNPVTLRRSLFVSLNKRIPLLLPLRR
jgi:hypothetical protein